MPLLERDDVPEHVRSLTSERVLAVEADLVDSIVARAAATLHDAGRLRGSIHLHRLDPAQHRVVAALAGDARLLVIEGAAGAGKTTTLAAARDVLNASDRRLVVVTPTRRRPKPRSSRSAPTRLRPPGSSTSTATGGIGRPLVPDRRRTRIRARASSATSSSSTRPACSTRTPPAPCSRSPTEPTPPRAPGRPPPAAGRRPRRRPRPRRTLGAPAAHHGLESVHRFSDPTYADLSLLMRTGERSGEVFQRSSSAARSSCTPARSNAPQPSPPSGPRADNGEQLVIADTRDQVAALNAAIRDHRHDDHSASRPTRPALE